MESLAVQPLSHATPNRAARSSAPENGTERAPFSGQNALDPAVVSHVQRAGTGGKSATSPDEQSSPEQAEEAEEIRKLRARDSEVRAHEQAHAATGGALAGAPSYQFQRGPDGRSYAVSGEVSIDVSAVSNDAQATIQKMQQVKRAALAPANPSDADRAIAAMAEARIMAARLELSTGGIGAIG